MMDHMIGAVRQAARRFYAQYDPAATAAYVRANCRSEAEHLLHQAEDLMQNTFVFTDRWDMEPCAVPYTCLLYTSPSPRDVEESRMPSSA